jgi:hypothetical protein
MLASVQEVLDFLKEEQTRGLCPAMPQEVIWSALFLICFQSLYYNYKLTITKKLNIAILTFFIFRFFS